MNDGMRFTRGSGNVFRDCNMTNADLEQLRSTLAARILHVMNDRGLSVRKLAEATKIDAADFSRLRQAKLGRFTVDRLMTILDKLDQDVEIAVTVSPRPTQRIAQPQPGLF